ncbi:MAG: hypothetical protein RLZZ299_2808 [Pseudomonadota bacterium]|jgi:protein-S-isoprenylcysteine O-methyltransferase Ste14
MFRVASSPPILLMVAKVYVPVLFPLTFGIALAAARLDRALGLDGGMLAAPARYAVAAALLGAGLAIVGVSYAELVTAGEGSPSPTAGRTLRLVRTGIYAHCRNPSVHGKLLGVLAVGVALDSPSFCGVLVPLLLAGSLLEKAWRQEPQLIAVFGEEYLRYREEVPLFVPWKLLGFRRRL